MSKRGILERVVGGYILLITFLLPIKFGTLAVLPESTSFFPSEWWEYLVISWPASSFGIFSGVALILALIAFPQKVADYMSSSWRTMILWSVGIPVVALLGFVNASCLDFPIMQLSHFLAIGAWIAAVYLYCSVGGGEKVLLSLVLGTLLLGWFGIEQYFWGFEASRQFLLKQEEAGLVVSEAMRARTFDSRIFATFTSCNSLAGYLLLMLFPVAYRCFLWGNRFEPVKLSRTLFAVVSGGALLMVLLLTGSRAAYLSLVVVAGLLVLCWPMKRVFKGTIIVLALLVCVAGGVIICYSDRGFSSMGARTDYIRSAFLLWLESPIFGCGWGEFFFGHMQLKSIISREAAHDPHNIILMASQAGTLMIAVVVAAIVYPWVAMVKNMLSERDKGNSIAGHLVMIIGVALLFGHALMDIDSQIPAIMAAWGIIYMVDLTTISHGFKQSSKGIRRSFWVLLMVLALGSLIFSYKLVQGERAFDKLFSITSSQTHLVENPTVVTPDMVHRALLEVAKHRPYSAFPYGVAGDYFLSRGLVADAKIAFERSLELAPKRASIYKRFAVICQLRGDVEGAKRNIDRALELFPHHKDYKSLRDTIYGTEKN